MSYLEERQLMKDAAYVEAEKDIMYWQEYADEIQASQKPAKIQVILEEEEFVPEGDDLL